MKTRFLLYLRNFLLPTCGLIMLSGTFSASAEQHYFRLYSVEDGLAQSQVYAIFQDRMGYIWFGTNGGISRFDGKSFRNFGRKEGLGNSTVNAIAQHRNGNLWFATFGGAYVYDGKKFRSYGEKDGLSNVRLYHIAFDRKGNAWLASNGGGAFHFDGQRFINYSRKDGLPDDEIWFILPDRKGHIWFATSLGVSRYDGKTFTNFSKADGLAGNEVFSIMEDRSGNIWIATNSGVSRYDGNRFINYTRSNGLLGNVVWTVMEDRAGNIWMGMTGGVSRLKKDSVDFGLTQASGLPEQVVYSLMQDRDGNLWIGTNGGGVCQYPGSRFVAVTAGDGLPSNIIRSIGEDQEGNIWFGTQGEGLVKYDGRKITRFTEKDGINGNYIYAIEKGEGNEIWMASNKGLIRYEKNKFTIYGAAQGLHNEYIYTLFKDSKGQLWLGTRKKGGLIRFDGKKFDSPGKGALDEFDIRKIVEGKDGKLWIATSGGLFSYDGTSFRNFSLENNLPSNIITLMLDSLGNLWAGTYGDGIIRLAVTTPHPKRKIDMITAADGLADENIVLITADGRGSLWIGTNRGVSRLNIAEYYRSGKKDIRNYGKSEGFTGIECNQNAVAHDRRGRIWFGTINGAIRYNPDEDLSGSRPPFTHITGVRLFLEHTDWRKQGFRDDSITHLPLNLVLNYKKNHLTFDFIGISYNSPEKVIYRYKLEGADDDWLPETRETHATYSNIPPGNYVFKVKACNSERTWDSTPAEFCFSIAPPFWMTWWFYITSGLLGVTMVYGITQYRIRNLKRQRKILEGMVDERTRELRDEKEKVELYNKEITVQKEIIEQKNKDITDSIEYAKRIQVAILPTREVIGKAFPESFIFYKPKDIVSGDFFWYASRDGKYYIAAVDCTGHGVPGAFMSMIGTTLLNDFVNEKAITVPADILAELDEGIRIALKQDQAFSESRDGMDVALCSIEPQKSLLHFAGAYRPLYRIRNGKITEIKGDKFAIGGLHKEAGARFKNHTISYEKNDAFYMFTDGYADQFGGPSKKKFLAKRFQELLAGIQDLPMTQQEKRIEEAFNSWKGAEEQVDDVLVVGFRL